jgi:hypothetical protein
MWVNRVFLQKTLGSRLQSCEVASCGSKIVEEREKGDRGLHDIFLMSRLDCGCYFHPLFTRQYGITWPLIKPQGELKERVSYVPSKRK